MVEDGNALQKSLFGKGCLVTRRNAVEPTSTAVRCGPQGLLASGVGAIDTAKLRAIEVGPTTGRLTPFAVGGSHT